MLTVILNDIQLPFADRPVLDKVIDFIYELSVDQVILNGDIVDCFTLSDFDRNPLTEATLLDEIREAQLLMTDFEHIEYKVWIGGNHEDRLRRYIWNHAKAFAGIAGLEFENLFDLSAYGFNWIPYGSGLDLGRLYVTHGEYVRTSSGASARKHFEEYGTSVIHGHTHRLGAYYKTRRRKMSVAYENGCLCSMYPGEWCRNPDWQQGFSVVHSEPSGEFNVQQVPIFAVGEKKVFYYGGEKFEI